MTDTPLQDLLEYMRTRFLGKYRGVVTEVDAATMRIKARVPAVLRQRGDQRLVHAVRALRGAAGRLRHAAGTSAAGCGSSSRAATSPFRSGPAAIGTTATCRTTPPPTSRSIITKAGSLHFDNQNASVTAQVERQHIRS